MKNYTLMNLSMISRLAVLENAERTGKAINALTDILRYVNMNEKDISTVADELAIVEKMFELHRLKKGSAFVGIIQNDLGDNKCYIDKGEVVAYVNLALGKKIGPGRESLEVIVSAARKEDRVVIIIKDDGATDVNETRENLEDHYRAVLERYPGKPAAEIAVKPGIGTRVCLKEA